MAIECENCRSSEHFRIQDGVTFCTNCGTESQEHGQETVVDDETIGAFGSAASQLKKKSVRKRSGKKKRRGDRTKKSVQFSSIDVFTFILKGWTEEAIELGASESLKPLVRALWMNYLKQIKMAFTDKPGLSKYPAYRDVQTKIFPQKQGSFISGMHVGHAKKCRKTAKKADLQAALSTDSDEENSREARRRRKKRRREFLATLASDTSDTINSSSFISTDEDVSLPSLANSSTFDSESISTSMQSSSVPPATPSSEQDSSSAAESEDTSGDEADDAQACRQMVLERLTLSKRRSKSVECPTLKLVFALFCMAVLLSDNNTLTLSQLIHFAQCDAISLYNSLKNVPSAMKMSGNQDLKMFTTVAPVSHVGLRKVMKKLGLLIDLKTADFSVDGDQVTVALSRVIRELALPQRLNKIIESAVRKTDLLSLKYTFDKKNPDPVVSADLRALGLLLYALKYLYGLDDISEDLRSATAKKLNEVNVIKRFVFSDWICLSRKRAFLACRYSTEPRQRFNPLFSDRVQESPATLAKSVFDICDQMSRIRTDDKDDKCDKPFHKGDTDRMKKVSAFLKSEFAPEFRKLPTNTVDLSRSKWPLHDFSVHFTATQDILESTDERLTKEDLEDLERLMAMYDQKIGLRCADEKSELVTVRPNIVMTRLESQDLDLQSNLAYIYEEKAKVLEPKLYNFEPTYWRLPIKGRAFFNREAEWNQHLLTCLPESFAWVLRYFAAVAQTTSLDLYRELLHVEQTLLAHDPGYFGPYRKTVDRYSGALVAHAENRL